MSEEFPEIPTLTTKCSDRRVCFLDFTYYLECDDWCERHNLLRTERKYGEPYQYSIRMGIGAGNAIRIYDDAENRIDLESEDKRIATSNSLGTLFEIIGANINSNAPNNISEVAFNEININAPNIKTVSNQTLIAGITPDSGATPSKYGVNYDPGTQSSIYIDGSQIIIKSNGSISINPGGALILKEVPFDPPTVLSNIAANTASASASAAAAADSASKVATLEATIADLTSRLDELTDRVTTLEG